jgi:hypothetical protein
LICLGMLIEFWWENLLKAIYKKGRRNEGRITLRWKLGREMNGQSQDCVQWRALVRPPLSTQSVCDDKPPESYCSDWSKNFVPKIS